MIYKLLFKLIEKYFIWRSLHQIYVRKPYITKIDNKLKVNRGYKQFKQLNRKQFQDNSL